MDISVFNISQFRLRRDKWKEEEEVDQEGVGWVGVLPGGDTQYIFGCGVPLGL